MLSLARCLTFQDTTPCSGEDLLYECGRLRNTLSCLFFTALRLRQSQSILTQVQQTNDIDLTCYKTLPTKSVTCLQVRPMSLEWPVAPPAESDQSCPSFSHEDPNDEHPEGALPAPPHPRWRRDALQPPQTQRGSLDRNTCVHIPDCGLRCVTWNTRGLIGSVTSSQISREQNHNYFRRSIKNKNLICLQEVHGKDEFLQAIPVLAPRFRLYGIFIPGNANAGGSAICIHKDILPDDAVVTHKITCQSRDHIVNVRSGCRNLVVVNVRFEPELTLRNLRERLCFITPHWPQYPDAIGIIMGDFNICQPEEGRFNVWNQTFTDGDTGKAASA